MMLANYLHGVCAQKMIKMEENTMTNMQDGEKMEIPELQTEMNINADSDVPGNTHLEEPLGDDNEIEILKASVEEQKDKYMRLFAEFDNYKKRTAKEYMDLRETAGKEVIISMLDVLDDVERAEKQMETTEDLTQIKDGITLVFNKFKSTLLSKGLKPMESIGEDFNVDLHEAITEIPAPNEEMVGKNLDEVTKGYFLRDKIIRFAKVVVGK
jgi:molecular chaperone GrpE